MQLEVLVHLQVIFIRLYIPLYKILILSDVRKETSSALQRDFLQLPSTIAVVKGLQPLSFKRPNTHRRKSRSRQKRTVKRRLHAATSCDYDCSSSTLPLDAATSEGYVCIVQFHSLKHRNVKV